MEPTSYKKALQLMDEQKKAIIQKLCVEILSLPDNPEIIRKGNGSFTVNSAQIAADGGIMSASHYDFKKQYELLANKLVQTDDINALENILAAGKITTLQYTHPVILHKTVIDNVQKILGA